MSDVKDLSQKKFKAVLFDLDGTLLNTLEDIADCMNTALEELNLPAQPVDAFRYYVGDGMPKVVERALQDALSLAATLSFESVTQPPFEELQTRALKRMQELYAQNWNQKTVAYEGISELLAELEKRGLTLAIFSNKPHEATLQCVDAQVPGGLKRFDKVYGASSAWPKKPNPKQALQIAQECGIAPSNWLYLGDTSVDMTTAIQAGMTPIGVLWGFRPPQELIEAGAQRLIEKPMELISMLNQSECEN